MSEGLTEAIKTFRLSKPVSSPRRFCSVRRSNAAVMSNGSESATCKSINPLRRLNRRLAAVKLRDSKCRAGTAA